jgi:SAM-dependent methyltransferase
MTVVSPEVGYRAWGPSYDDTVNPLLALEERVLKERLEIPQGDRVLDLATGTGRWLQPMVRQVRAVGMDRSAEMLAVAAKKADLRGRLAQADLKALPFATDCAILAICSFSLSYSDDPDAVLRECTRVAEKVVITDMHPAAIEAGWVRSFRSGNQSVAIEHVRYTKASLLNSAHDTGLELMWCVDAYFEPRDFGAFVGTTQEAAFSSICTVPAVLLAAWRRG